MCTKQESLGIGTPLTPFTARPPANDGCVFIPISEYNRLKADAEAYRDPDKCRPRLDGRGVFRALTPSEQSTYRALPVDVRGEFVAGILSSLRVALGEREGEITTLRERLEHETETRKSSIALLQQEQAAVNSSLDAMHQRFCNVLFPVISEPGEAMSNWTYHYIVRAKETILDQRTEIEQLRKELAAAQSSSCSTVERNKLEVYERSIDESHRYLNTFSIPRNGHVPVRIKLLVAHLVDAHKQQVQTLEKEHAQEFAAQCDRSRGWLKDAHDYLTKLGLPLEEFTVKERIEELVGRYTQTIKRHEAEVAGLRSELEIYKTSVSNTHEYLSTLGLVHDGGPVLSRVKELVEKTTAKHTQEVAALNAKIEFLRGANLALCKKPGTLESPARGCQTEPRVFEVALRDVHTELNKHLPRGEYGYVGTPSERVRILVEKLTRQRSEAEQKLAETRKALAEEQEARSKLSGVAIGRYHQLERVEKLVQAAFEWCGTPEGIVSAREQLRRIAYRPFSQSSYDRSVDDI